MAAAPVDSSRQPHRFLPWPASPHPHTPSHALTASGSIMPAQPHPAPPYTHAPLTLLPTCRAVAAARVTTPGVARAAATGQHQWVSRQACMPPQPPTLTWRGLRHLGASRGPSSQWPEVSACVTGASGVGSLTPCTAQSVVINGMLSLYELLHHHHHHHTLFCLAPCVCTLRLSPLRWGGSTPCQPHNPCLAQSIQWTASCVPALEGLICIAHAEQSTETDGSAMLYMYRAGNKVYMAHELGHNLVSLVLRVGGAPLASRGGGSRVAI